MGLHLVTGSAGFIGSSLAHQLAAEGHDLVLCDFPASGEKAKNLEGLRPVTTIPPERLWGKGVPRLPAKVDAVWHLGANSDTTAKDWDELTRVNITASQTLWRWCASEGVPYYYASSAATYGDGSAGFSDRIRPDRLSPLNLYGKSKNEFDAWALAEVAEGRAAPPKWAGFKFFNVYGAREAHKGRMASILWKAERDLAAHGKVLLFKSNDPGIADGEQRRDFVWVGEVIDQMRWVAAHPAPNAIYNAGTGVASTFLEMVHAWFKARGEAPRIELVPMPPDLSRQYQNFTRADMSALRDAGYDRAPVLPADGVARTLAGIAELRDARLDR
jgi:ADP-L-glycero-D-manno-heptose 6-epimerase